MNSIATVANENKIGIEIYLLEKASLDYQPLSLPQKKRTTLLANWIGVKWIFFWSYMKNKLLQIYCLTFVLLSQSKLELQEQLCLLCPKSQGIQIHSNLFRCNVRLALLFISEYKSPQQLHKFFCLIIALNKWCPLFYRIKQHFFKWKSFKTKPLTL